MKYGVVFYKDTDNIGDDIQSYAVMQFLPHVDYLIDREKLCDFSNDEDVAVVMNGWFLHNKYNWPPAKGIYPLCVSMHFSPNDYIEIGYKFLDGIGGEYLKNYGPVGCRDLSTKNVLDSKGIPNYLSGCATLTLSQREKNADFGKYVCIVDVPDEVEESIRVKLGDSGKELQKVTHWVDYRADSITWEERIRKVEDTLDVYQNAFCVVTKRLHCALPCLALGTPVLLILDTDKDDVTRYSHFTELLYVTSTQDFLDGKAEYDLLNPPQNKEAYRRERENLIEAIKKFVVEVESGKISNNFYKWKEKNEEDISAWRQELSGNSLRYAANQIDALLREKNAILAKTYEENKKFAKQYSHDTSVLESDIGNKANEINRLNQVIEDKNTEERRLNRVIEDKNTEERRLNQIIEDKNTEERRLNQTIEDKNTEERRLNKAIEDKNTEERRLNQVIEDKNTEERRLNQVILDKDGIINHLNLMINSKDGVINEQVQMIENYEYHSHRILEYCEKLENTSVIWVLFFSSEFKKFSFKQKVKRILDTLKARSASVEKSGFLDVLLELRKK